MREASMDRAVARNPTVAGLSLASFFSDLGHEMATAVLPGFLRSIARSPRLRLSISFV